MVGSGTRRLLVSSWVRALQQFRHHGLNPLSEDDAEMLIQGAKQQLDASEAEAVAAEGNRQMTTSVVARLRHSRWGACELVRVEATDWIVRVESTGVQYRVSSERRGQFEVIYDEPEQPPEEPKVRPLRRVAVRDDAAARNARRVIESLRIGLQSLDGSTRRLAVGFKEMQRLIGTFLRDIDSDGGGAMIMKGAYGQGKTFALTMLEEIAHESGFVTVRTEIDATENQLNKPHHIYRDMMKHLRVPGSDAVGVRQLACEAHQLIQQQTPQTRFEREQWLEERLECSLWRGSSRIQCFSPRSRCLDFLSAIQTFL